MANKVVWDTPVSGGSVWTISILDGKDDPEWEDLQGQCLHHANEIQINLATTAVAEVQAVRHHEEIHKAFDKSGFRQILRTLFGLTEEQATNLEEICNLTVGQYHFDYLTRNGYLKYPDVPEAVEEDPIHP